MSKESFQSVEAEVMHEVEKEPWFETFKRVTEIINHIGKEFSSMNWWEMAELKYKLSWYKYYLSSFVWEFQRKAEFYHLEIKNYRAEKWNEVSGTIKAEKWKVSNKEEIENEILRQTYELHCKEIIYTNFFYQYKIKLSAIDDIITCIVQRLSTLKAELQNI